MTLERWLALLFLLFSLAYGYSSFFVMDGMLPVFAKLSPVWPSSFPKILSLMGISIGFGQLFFWSNTISNKELDRDNMGQYEWRQVGSVILLMILYALLLRTFGFVLSTVSFLSLAAMVLGERNYKWLVPISLVGAFGIWYLVDQVLGIFLRPWPFFVYGGL